jgi:hypothetical protein
VAGRETTALPGNLTIPITFNASLIAQSAVASQIQALEICQVFMISFVLKRTEHLENSDEETNIKMENRGEKMGSESDSIKMDHKDGKMCARVG